MGRAIRYAAVVVVLAATAGVPADAAGELDLTGLYVARGVNADGSEYEGVVHIAPRRQSFVVTWIFPRGSRDMLSLEPASVGIGIVSGETLAVSYLSMDAAGVVVYRIEDGGNRLAGQWTVVGKDGVIHAETLTKLPRRMPEPVEADPLEDWTPSNRPPISRPAVRL
jgi:hypothetical protein